VVELRVHGVLGSNGDKLTDSVASVDVAGDGIGRIVRPADRLRRPVPGPMLSAGERTVPRIIEGYVWGGMTSGGWTKATWALLFPFALANVAHWMLPAPRPDKVTSKMISGVLRALLRLSALLLTMLFVAQLTVISLDLLAAQCLYPGSTCLKYVPDAFREVSALRLTLALAPVALVVLLMHRLSSVSWQVSAGRNDTPHHSARAPMLPGANVVSDPDTPALRALHVVAALSTVVVLALGGPTSATFDPRWLAASALLLISVVGTLGIDDPTGLHGRTWSRALRSLLGRTTRRVLMSIGGVLLVSIVLAPPPMSGPLIGSAAAVDAITLLLLITCVTVGVLLIPAAMMARPTWSHLPRHLRPWAGGWMAAPVLLIACLLGTGFGAGLAQTLRQTLGTTTMQLPAAYHDVTIFWGTTTTLLAIAIVLLLPVVLVKRWRTSYEDAVPDEVALLHAGRQQDQRRAASAWRWAEMQQRHGHRVVLLVAGVLATSTATSIALRLLGVAGFSWSEALGTVGVATLAALAVVLLRLVYLAATERTTARYLGVLCDFALFWPREAHPVVPPCYALKVIPELAARAAEHLAEPDTRVVLCGHSQGSLLATVATARLLETLPEADRERVGLVTAGSQLQWAYPRAFPSVVPHSSLEDLAGTMGGRWRSLCRGTDPLGGAVSTWNRQVYDGMLLGVGFRTDGTSGPLSAASRGPTGALVLGGDHWLPDPQRGPFSFRRWVPGVLGHSDYTVDPEWDRAVSMAASLEIPVRGATLPLRTPTTTPVPPARTGTTLHAHGGDGGSIAGPDHPACTDGTHVAAERGAEDEAPVAEAPVEPEVRPETSELPEISEPLNRTAPWERGSALRASDR
jgi:hypothetical protein